MNKDSAAHHFISELPEVKKAGLHSYSQLTGGSTNINWKVETSEGIWVVRKNADQVAGVNRALEARILEQIAPLNISAKLIAAKPDQGYLITEFIEGETWTQSDCNNPQRLQILFNTIKKVHAISINEPVTGLKSRMHDYLSLSQKNVRQAYQASAEHQLEEIEQLGFFDQQKLCHFDLNHTNLIGVDSIKILDWEFVGMAHPILDYAILSVYENPNEQRYKASLAALGFEIKLYEAVRKTVQCMMKIWSNL